MDNSKSAKFMLPLKGLSARPCNFQVIHDARKKCRGDFRTESNLSIQARQMTDDLKECFREELDKIPSLNPDKRESLISDVDKYIQSLFKLLGDGKDKDHLDFNERDRLTSEHASLVDRLKALQKSADTQEIKTKQSYQEFLIDVASKTHRLIKSNKERFRSQVQEFIGRFDKWRNAVFEAQQAALDDPTLNIGGDDMPDLGKPPQEGYFPIHPNEFAYSHEDILPSIKGYFWAPPLPCNPVDTLRPREPLVLDFPERLINGHAPMLKREPRDNKEDLLRKYFLLAVIHSLKGHGGVVVEQCPEAWTSPQNKAVEYTVVELVWDMYEDAYMDDRKESYWGASMRALIDDALFDVEADLRTGDGQVNPPVIEIDTSQFSDGPSKKLIENLAASPSGVKKNEGLYSKHQPKNLKTVLKGTKYDEVRKHIRERKGTIYLDGISLKIKK